jgi:hypothetical protein
VVDTNLQTCYFMLFLATGASGAGAMAPADCRDLARVVPEAAAVITWVPPDTLAAPVVD